MQAVSPPNSCALCSQRWVLPSQPGVASAGVQTSSRGSGLPSGWCHLFTAVSGFSRKSSQGQLQLPLTLWAKAHALAKLPLKAKISAWPLILKSCGTRRCTCTVCAPELGGSRIAVGSRAAWAMEVHNKTPSPNTKQTRWRNGSRFLRVHLSPRQSWVPSAHAEQFTTPCKSSSRDLMSSSSTPGRPRAHILPIPIHMIKKE